MREVAAAREIARASLTSSEPAEVYRLALERVVPLVGASFACIFHREDGAELLRVVAAHNWPPQFEDYLSEMRVRLGNGPTGQAVAENRVVEAPDIFADPGLEDWWASARELGFTASIALPLHVGGEAVGALTFYFPEPRPLGEAERHLLQLVADQLAATAQKAQLAQELQRANDLLREQNTELEIKYREAEEARRLKNEFLANVSHELRTPLTAILGFAYLLREGLGGTLQEEQGQAVRKIEQAGTALVHLIDDLLDLAQLKLGRTKVEPVLCDAAALLRSAAAAAPPAADGVEVLSEIPEGRVPVHTDPDLVVRILANLLSNAVKFTREGTVTLRVRSQAAENGDSARRGDTIVWEVEDTGIGISPEDQVGIFDEFRQVDGSVTRRFGGVGLGLALSQGFARRLGGEIRVRSELERGSCFTLSLPSGVVRAGGEDPSPRRRTRPSGSRGES